VSDADAASALHGEHSSPDEESMRDYARALDFSFPGPEQVVDATVLQKLNRVVLGRENDPPSENPWRLEVMSREAFDGEGKALGWVFPTLPPRMIEEKINDLLTWLEFELRSGARHPLPVIGAFMLGFLAISPFERGNGRTSRALVRHLLVRAGYAHLPFASLESELESDRPAYLTALFQARTGVWSGTAELSPWIEFFLDSLERHRARVESKLALEQGSLSLPPLQREILETVREHGTANAGLLLKATGANRNTLKDNLRRMVAQGVLRRTGQKRGTRYRLAAPDATRGRPPEASN
jgi:Fic family protein